MGRTELTDKEYELMERFALNNDELIRDVIGECVCPGIEYKIMQNIPRK